MAYQRQGLTERTVGRCQVGKAGVLGPQPYLPGGIMAVVQRTQNLKFGLVACVKLCTDTPPDRGNRSRGHTMRVVGGMNE